jgi:hypothetical protein
VHDEYIGLSLIQTFEVEPIELRILAAKGSTLLTLQLQAQDHDDIGVTEGGIEVVQACTPSDSTCIGNRLAGPQTRTSMPIVRIAKMFERATRLWAISPMMLTRNPTNVPLR